MKKYPCYAFIEGKCKVEATCRFTHRALTPQEEKQRKEALAKKEAAALPAQGEHAGVCPKWLLGKCTDTSCKKGKHPKKLKGVKAS